MQEIKILKMYEFGVDGRMVNNVTVNVVDPMPVLTREGADGRLVGKIHHPVIDMERGWVTGLLEILDPDFDPRGLAAEADTSDALWHEVTRTDGSIGTVIDHCRLKAVYIGERPCWEGMEIGDDE